MSKPRIVPGDRVIVSADVPRHCEFVASVGSVAHHADDVDAYVYCKALAPQTAAANRPAACGFDGWVPAAWCRLVATKPAAACATVASTSAAFSSGYLSTTEEFLNMFLGIAPDSSDGLVVPPESPTLHHEAAATTAPSAAQHHSSGSTHTSRKRGSSSQADDGTGGAPCERNNSAARSGGGGGGGTESRVVPNVSSVGERDTDYPVSLVYLGFEMCKLIKTAWAAVLDVPPPQGGVLHSVHLCHRCLTPLPRKSLLQSHFSLCACTDVPSTAVQVFACGADIAVYRVDGALEPEFCMRLMILGRCFISAKDLWETDVQDIEFFALYGSPARLGLRGAPGAPGRSYDSLWMAQRAAPSHKAAGGAAPTSGQAPPLYFAGYFSRVKREREHTLSCIVLLPCFHARGLGGLLVRLAYRLDQERVTACGCELCGSGPGRVSQPWSAAGRKLLCAHMYEKLALGARRLLSSAAAAGDYGGDGGGSGFAHHQQQRGSFDLRSAAPSIVPSMFAFDDDDDDDVGCNGHHAKPATTISSSGGSASSASSSNPLSAPSSSQAPQRRQRSQSAARPIADPEANVLVDSPLQPYCALPSALTWDALARRLTPSLHPLDCFELLLSEHRVASVTVPAPLSALRQPLMHDAPAPKRVVGVVVVPRDVAVKAATAQREQGRLVQRHCGMVAANARHGGSRGASSSSQTSAAGGGIADAGQSLKLLGALETAALQDPSQSFDDYAVSMFH